jgi:hypothetical protein
MTGARWRKWWECARVRDGVLQDALQETAVKQTC